jgi:peptide/nickel transport system substrate-binding protein
MVLAKKLRFQLLLLQKIATKHKKLLILGAGIGILVFFVGSRLVLTLSNIPRNLSIGVIGQFNPTNLPPEISSLVGNGLTAVTDDGSVVPSLAKSWEASDSSRVFRFEIPENLYWHDGTRVEATDLNFSFKDVNVSYISDTKLEFRLNDSYTPFPAIVTRPLIKIKESKLPLLSKYLPCAWRDKIIGTGEYQFSCLRSNPHGTIMLKLTSFEKPKRVKTFKFYQTEDEAITAFKLGHIDEINDLTSTHGLETWQSVTVTSKARKDRFVAILFNTQSDLFNNKNIRQALAYAIDKSVFADRAIGPLNPSSWAFNDQVKPYDLDLEKAKSMLQKENVKDAEIEISTFAWLLDSAEKIKKNWEQAGIKASIKVVSSIPSEFDVLLAAQKIPADPDQYTLWHSTQQSNLTRVKNPKIDKLLEDGRKTDDKNSRQKIYLDFQRFLIEESPAVFLYHPISYSISRK